MAKTAFKIVWFMDRELLLISEIGFTVIIRALELVYRH
jgi:hypothetical protein